MRSPLVVVACLLVAALAGAATPPASTSWSPATLPTITAFGVSADGGILVAGFGSTAGGIGGGIGGVPNPQTRDIAVYDHARGFVWNNSCTACAGRLDLAVSANGDYIVTGGAASSSALQLLRRNANTWGPAEGWPKQTSADVADLALSADASVVAALVGTTADNTLVQYGRDGQPRSTFPSGSTEPVFKAHKGQLRAVAVSSDGQWVAVGGAYTVNNATGGVVYLLKAGSADGGYALLPSPVRSLAITRDGTAVVAGTESASFAWLTRIDFAGSVNRAVLTAPGAVRDVAIAPDHGAIVAVAHANGVSAYAPGTGNLTNRWHANLTGGALDVDVSGDGKTIVAASPAGAVGFASHLASPLYTLSGARSRVGLGVDGKRVTFASNGTLDARTHAPSILIQQVDAQGNPLAVPSPVPVNPGDRATFLVGVANNGTFADRGELLIPTDLAVVANRTTYEARPGDRWIASITLTPPASTVPDTYNLVVRAVSEVTGQTQNLTLQYVVGARAGVALVMPPNARTAYIAKPGQDVRVDFSIVNLGNDGGTFTLGATQAPSAGGSWPVTLVPDGPTFVGRQSSTAASFFVRVPTTARDGTSNDVRIVARLGDVTSLPIDLSFIVNPVIAVNLTSDALGRLVTSGNAAWFNLTLKNTGSVQATYHVTWDPVETPPPPAPRLAWNSEVTGLDEFGTLVLKPGEKRPLTVKLFAPQGAPAGAVGTLRMYAKDVPLGHERVKVTEWLNLSATVVPRDVHTPQNTGGVVLPGPELALVAGAAVAVALLSRRRSA